MSNTYLQSAEDLLVVDIKVPVNTGSPLQALVPKSEANQIWSTEPVPAKPGYFWIVSAAKGSTGEKLVVDIKMPVNAGSPLQALIQKNEGNQYWTTEPVPGKPGYFWIVSAAKDSAGKNLVFDIKVPVGSGSALQAFTQKNEDNQYWRYTNVQIELGFQQFVIAGTGFAPGSKVTGNSSYAGSLKTVAGGPYTLAVDSLGTINSGEIPLLDLEFNVPGTLTVEVVDSSWALSATASVPVPASE
jgi:hypothetical protein